MAATIKDVAKLADVSTATVSYVINGSQFISDKTKNRVERAMKELNYHPSALARNLRIQKTNTIGFIIPNISNQYFTSAAKGIEKVLRVNGYNLLVSDSEDDESVECERIKVFTSLKVDGLIISSAGKESDIFLKDLSDSNPVVFFDRRPKEFECDFVVLDNYRATYDAISMLLMKKHTNIGMLLGKKHISTTQDRIMGCKQAYKDYGIDSKELRVVHGDFTIESGRLLATELLRPELGITALFIANGLMTIGAFMVVKEYGLMLSEDLAIIGCDDSEWALVSTPPMSMIYQPSYEMGKLAADILLRKIKVDESKHEKIFFPAVLNIRGSI
jgi:LacI family transcriptional regulator